MNDFFAHGVRTGGALCTILVIAACSAPADPPSNAGRGGATTNGGANASSGGSGTQSSGGGANTSSGGMANAGSNGNGGAAQGGTTSGGNGAGGTSSGSGGASGGFSQGGSATGGAAQGGTTSGGANSAGSASGGAAHRDHCVEGYDPDPSDANMADGPAEYTKSGQVDLTVQPGVLNWMQQHVWEEAHFQWHNIRRCTTTMVDRTRDGGLDPCKHTELVPADQEGKTAGDGLQFLAMHRHM